MGREVICSPYERQGKRKLSFIGGAFMPQKGKLKAEEKISLIRRYQEGEISFGDAVAQAGGDRKTFRRWVKRYEAEGAAGFFPYERNRVYSEELKKAAVHAYLSGEGSQTDITQKYQLRSDKQLRNWLKVYHTHGTFSARKNSGGGSYMRKARSTTQEERIQIARECIALGKNYGEIALKYEVSYQQVRTWTLRFEAQGAAGLEDRRGKRKKDQTPRTELERLQVENEQLKHKLYLAELERDLLKKLDEIERRDAFRK